jgi:heme exporter protein A
MPQRLVVRDLAAARGGEVVISGIGFELGPGDSLVVTGPNGSGKSTLLRVLAGLLPASQGSVRVEGAGEPPHIHYVGHRNAMKTALTVRENLEFWRQFCGHPRLEVEEALARVRLAGIPDLPFGYLSAGQRRRATLARLLLAHRPIWLLDEPTAALDSASRSDLAEIMTAHLDSGGIIVAATHEPLGLARAAQLRLGTRAA